MEQRTHKTDCFEISEFIFDKLNPIVATYPIIEKNGAQFPFCVYRRISFNGSDTKDRFNYEESVNIEIQIMTDNYRKGLELASEIKERLELLKGIWRNTCITNILLLNASEDIYGEAYVQTLIFQISMDNDKYRKITQMQEKN